MVMGMRTKQNIVKRRTSNVDKKKYLKYFFLAIIACISSQLLVVAQIQTKTETIDIEATVISNTVSPATPPPVPSLITNNGVPLIIESGTDKAIFRGKSYPGSSIAVLKNGLIVNELSSYADGTFEVPVNNILPGVYTFSLSAKDENGLRSSSVPYTVVVSSGAITEVNDIIMPPTLTTDKTEVRSGDPLIFSGYSIPNSNVTISIFVQGGNTASVLANDRGVWLYNFQTKNISIGNYNAKARAKIGGINSPYSETVLFTVGTKNTLRKSGSTYSTMRCDLNNDLRVNLLDFSIMAFWYKRLGFPAKVDLNSDKRINLTDLSILAYCWTG